MNNKQSLERNLLYLVSPHGQGIVAAPQAYFAKQSMERARRGTAESPVYTLSARGSQRINAPKVAYGNYSRGIILGCIYDQKHRPPEHDTDNPSKSQLIQTKNHRIEIINEDGKEEIRVETAQGQMRAILSKKGIELINELDGGIEVSGKKINLKGKNVTVVAEKSLSMNSDGPAKFTEKGKFTFTSDKDATLKGKNIKMSGSKGVAAEGKQIAVQDDKVMGFDVHIMVVPSGSGTTTVPLPHPFIGKLADKLSKDVKIKDKACATKDSVAKHDDSMHMQQWAIGSWGNTKKQF